MNDFASLNQIAYCNFLYQSVIEMNSTRLGTGDGLIIVWIISAIDIRITQNRSDPSLKYYYGL